MKHVTPKTLITLLAPVLGFAMTGYAAEPQDAAVHETEAQEVAHEAGTGAGRLQLTVSPYAWGAGMRGTSTVGRSTSDVDVDLDQVLDKLKMGAMLDLHLEKGRWGAQMNLLYVGMGATVDGWSGTDYGLGLTRRKTDLNLGLWIIELNGRYQLSANWEVLAGLRYYQMDVDIKIKNLMGLGFEIDDSKDWVDPIIGLQYARRLGDRWSFVGRGDIGGFGVGSDFAWQASALFEYRIKEDISVAFGYRHLDWDYEDGSNRSEFGLDTYLTGPIAGMRFSF